MLSQCFGIFGSLLGQLKLDLAWSYRVQICCHSGMFFQIPGSTFVRWKHCSFLPSIPCKVKWSLNLWGQILETSPFLVTHSSHFRRLTFCCSPRQHLRFQLTYILYVLFLTWSFRHCCIYSLFSVILQASDLTFLLLLNQSMQSRHVTKNSVWRFCTVTVSEMQTLKDVKCSFFLFKGLSEQRNPQKIQSLLV